MAQLWGGRFTKETDKDVARFNASIGFDKRLLDFDVQGSIAHSEMLSSVGIITKDEESAIKKGLLEILSDVKEGNLDITDAAALNQ